jgi:hypothetical protein
MHYAETHLWEDLERAGNIWNGRWSQHLLEELLSEHLDTQTPPAEYSNALQWLSNLTLTLQKTQTALYSTRRHILWQMDLLPATTNVTSGHLGLGPMVLELRHFSLSGTFHTLEDSILQKGRLDTKADATWHRAASHLDKQS